MDNSSMKTLYHYTSSSGLLGIIESRELRATDIYFLNDFREFTHGMDQVRGLLDKAVANYQKRVGQMNKNVKTIYDLLQRIYPMNANYNHYITSFTDQRDNLRQWMSYGKSNASYCIAFKAGFYDSIKVPEGMISVMDKVNYDPFDHKQRTNLDEKIIEDFRLAIENKTDSPIRKIVTKQLRTLYAFNCTFKTSEFRDESETRFIFQLNSQASTDHDTPNYSNLVKFTERAGILIPHINIPFELKWIEEIIIGPNIQKEFAETGLKSLLSARGVNCKVSHTACTLRQF